MGLRSFLPVLFKRWCKFPTGAAAGYKNLLVFQELQADQGDPQQSAEWWNSFPEPSWHAAHDTGRLSDQQQERFCLRRRMLCRAQLKEADIVHDRSFCYVARLFLIENTAPYNLSWGKLEADPRQLEQAKVLKNPILTQGIGMLRNAELADSSENLGNRTPKWRSHWSGWSKNGVAQHKTLSTNPPDLNQTFSQQTQRNI